MRSSVSMIYKISNLSHTLSGMDRALYQRRRISALLGSIRQSENEKSNLIRWMFTIVRRYKPVVVQRRLANVFLEHQNRSKFMTTNSSHRVLQNCRIRRL